MTVAPELASAIHRPGRQAEPGVIPFELRPELEAHEPPEARGND